MLLLKVSCWQFALSFLVCLGPSIFGVKDAFAELKFIHHVSSNQSLPGELIDLRVSLQDSKDVNSPVFVEIDSEDGVEFTALASGWLNDNDSATFSIQVPASSQISKYRFLLIEDETVKLKSDYFSFNRSCAPERMAVSAKLPNELKGKKLLKRLLLDNQQLEYELLAYDNSLRLLENLNSIDLPTNESATEQQEEE